MRIFTKKSFGFTNPESGVTVRTKPLSFQDVPEWARKDALFQWALRDGDIEIIQDKKQEAGIERSAGKK